MIAQSTCFGCAAEAAHDTPRRRERREQLGATTRDCYPRRQHIIERRRSVGQDLGRPDAHELRCDHLRGRTVRNRSGEKLTC